MNLKKVARNTSGLTIIEVLISAVIFVVGFSIFVLMLSNTLSKLSVKETELATKTAEQFMMQTIYGSDTTALDTTVSRSGLSLQVHRQVTLEAQLARISVRVVRNQTGKELLHLYNEAIIPK